MKKHNFYSGPAILPEIVLERAQAAIKNFSETELSILEISHRSKEFVAVMDKARSLVKELMNLSDEYEVLFLQGGASLQFCMLPYNLLNADETAAYFDTGTWAHSAMEEAKLFGNTFVLGSSAKELYSHIPDEWEKGKSFKYIHLTTNNTIYGTQWTIEKLKRLKKDYSDTAIIADMSSDIFSRTIDYNIFDLIYAGAQKNIGAAGATLVVIKKSLLGKVQRKIPTLLDYSTHISNDSMKNTPSVFAVYTSYLGLEWIKEKGLTQIEKQNDLKANKLYEAIDKSTIFKGNVAVKDRSKMNVCFTIKQAVTEATDEDFISFAKQYGIVGIAGHRSVGGFRASIYNAMSLESVEVLIKAIHDFENKILLHS